MINKALIIAKTNFRNVKIAYIITAIVIGCILIQDLVMFILDRAGVFANPEGNMTVSLGNYLFLLVLLVPIFISALNFRKMMNLGAKRSDFFNGCAANYVIMAAVISFICIILYYTYDKFMISTAYRGGTLDVLYWFGWINNGVILAFFQQFAFLLLLAVAVHTLTAAQDRWYGWLADLLIVAVISVFTPIAPLRSALVWFLALIINHSNAFVQIAACLILATGIYSLNKLIFARKVI